MPARDDVDHDPAILDALDGLVPGVDRQLFTDRLLDRDLTALSYSARHGMSDFTDSYPGCRIRARPGGPRAVRRRGRSDDEDRYRLRIARPDMSRESSYTTMLKRSRSSRRASASSTACLARSSFAPDIEPERSSTKARLTGARSRRRVAGEPSVRRGRSGGCGPQVERAAWACGGHLGRDHAARSGGRGSARARARTRSATPSPAAISSTVATCSASSRSSGTRPSTWSAVT